MLSIPSSDLQTYDVHLQAKQGRILSQFEETARQSREAALQEERTRLRKQMNQQLQQQGGGEEEEAQMRAHLEEHMRHFEATLQNEIEAQRAQLMNTSVTDTETNGGQERSGESHSIATYTSHPPCCLS
jgi:septal ring factor EnvC (AmiA/AmiB activator)